MQQWAGAIVCVLLVILAIAENLLGFSRLWSQTLSVLVILAGAAWVVKGPAKLQQLSELYLWLAFVLPFGLLQVFAHRLAAAIGRDGFSFYCVVSVANLLLIVGALGALGAWSRRPPVASKPYPASLVAGLLIVGAVVFWAGAATFVGMSLERIAAHRGEHLWTSATFLLAALITAGGLLLLTLVLSQQGERFFSVLGFVAYLFGAVFWVIHLAFRLTVMVGAAEELTRTGFAPVWYEPWHRWSSVLFGVYSVLAYLALMAYGSALLKTGVVPRWVGWLCIGFALLQLPFFGPPLLIHVMPWLVGLMLLKRDKGKD